MKKWLREWGWTLGFAILIGIGLTDCAEGSPICGLKPMIPLGCSDAVCLCDGDECRWVYICD